MQFNPSSTVGIVYMTRFYAKASSSDLSNQDIANLSNASLDEIYPLASSADRTIQFDDPVYGDDPYESFSFTANNPRVSFGTDGNSAAVVGIRRIAVNTPNGWKILERGDIADATMTADEFIKGTTVAGTPNRFLQFGTDIVLDPVPSYSSTGRAFYRRNLKHFAAADTTASPGFAEPFHELVPLINAHRYAMREGKISLAQMLEKQIKQKKEDMIDFYGDLGENSLRITGKYVDPA